MEHATSPTLDKRNRELAELTILEIARQSSGDKIKGKVRLFKAFYFAHLYYAQESPSFLTEWPIVRMPKGPGIEDFPSLLRSLVEQGVIEVIPIKVGPYPSMKFRATGKELPYKPLPEDAVSAIRKAVKFVGRKTAAQLSEYTHEFSTSWNEAQDSQELSIYKDLLSDDERAELKESARELSGELRMAWGD